MVSLTRRWHGRLIAQLLVVALLLGAMPMAASAVTAEHENTPAFTLDVCHPLSIATVSAASCTLASFAASSFAIVIQHHGIAERFELPVVNHESEPPEPPPPET